MVLRPVGSQPTRVYWRRRVVLLLIVAIVVIIAVRACGSGGGGAGPNASGPGTTPRSTTSAPAATCGRHDIGITLRPSATSATVGASAEFTARVTLTGSQACQLLVPPASETWTISSTSATVWTDAGCQPAGGGVERVLEPGGHVTVRLKWDGKTSTGTCNEGDPPAAGTYDVTLRLAHAVSAPASLTLTSS